MRQATKYLRLLLGATSRTISPCAKLKGPPQGGPMQCPGGHVEFGETNEQTLIREFREEISADIKVDGLRWVAEMFFPWSGKSFHQICLYYDVSLLDDTQVPADRFMVTDIRGNQSFQLEFSWLTVSEIEKAKVYPGNAGELLRDLLKDPNSGVRHLVYWESDR